VVNDASLTWILDRQNADGGWGWALGQDSDTNSTSLAVQTLGLASDLSVGSAVAEALVFLRAQQRSDGGFPFVSPSPWGDDSDANSTAMVVQSLWAAGAQPTSLAWMTAPTQTNVITMSLKSPVERLLDFQLPTGAFEWQPGQGPNLMATVDALSALKGLTSPVPRSDVSPALQSIGRMKNVLLQLVAELRSTFHGDDL
jgi:prenyltransferase beta subunit